MFAGIGAFRQALKNQNIPHEIVGFSEIDKYAVEAYRAIHGDYETPNLGDIKGISHLPDCDLLTYGFPCQDLSIAGKGAGIKEGTRSGLLMEVKRLLDLSKVIGRLPKVLILENVKALVQKKHKADFDRWLKYLEWLGYTNYWQVLNAKDYGVPQNRERVFVISILGEHKPYEFPEKQELKLRLRDLLDDEVPENYYLQDEKVKAFLEKYKEKIQQLTAGVYPCLTPDRLEKRQNGRRFKGNNEEMFTLTAQDRHGVLEKIGSLTDKNSQGERVYTTDIAVTQNANGGGLGAKTGLYIVGELSTGGQKARVYNPKGSICCLTSTDYKDPPKILINEGINNPLKGLTPAGWHFEQNVYSLDSKLCRTVKAGGGSGNIPKILIDKDVLNCITANIGKGADLKSYFEKSKKQLVTDKTLRIRKLTPLECWRLMGFSDEAYQKARIALSNKFYKGKDRSSSQQYKQAGNSIVVNVLESILFINLYKKEEEE